MTSIRNNVTKINGEKLAYERDNAGFESSVSLSTIESKRKGGVCNNRKAVIMLVQDVASRIGDKGPGSCFGICIGDINQTHTAGCGGGGELEKGKEGGCCQPSAVQL